MDKNGGTLAFEDLRSCDSISCQNRYTISVAAFFSALQPTILVVEVVPVSVFNRVLRDGRTSNNRKKERRKKEEKRNKKKKGGGGGTRTGTSTVRVVDAVQQKTDKTSRDCGKNRLYTID